MLRFCLGALAILVAPVMATAQTCPKTDAATTFNGVRPWTLNNAVGFATSKLNVDADGAPNSYRVDGNGLSFTCDGVVGIVNGHRVTPDSDPEHWQAICRQKWAQAQQTQDFSSVAIFGFLTENGKPVVQKEGDPLPGAAFISTTSMSIPNTPNNTQRHWVDANEIPYIVLSGSFSQNFHVGHGDLAIVYRPSTQKMAFAVFADGGKLGEASVRLHKDLGANPISVSNGIERAKRRIEDRVLTIVFPGKTTHGTTDANAWRAEIEQMGQQALQEFGGIARVKKCASQP
jgi:glycosyl hydrolase group 75 (putative chitosanase)